MSDEEFSALLVLWKQGKGHLPSVADFITLQEFLNRESTQRGYRNWQEAFFKRLGGTPGAGGAA